MGKGPRSRIIAYVFPDRLTVTSVFLTLLFLLFSIAVAEITDQELDDAIGALTSNGYNLFANAIATSDLRYKLIAGDSFTLFAPTNSRVFSLDMVTEATDYVNVLQYHVVPRRLMISDLQDLSSGPYLDTLLPDHALLIENRQTTSTSIFSSVITVDGVSISAPGLYNGSGIAVHGLDGILTVLFPARRYFSKNLGSISPAISPDGFVPPVSSTTVSWLYAPVSPPTRENIPDWKTTANSTSKDHGKGKHHHNHRRRKRYGRKSPGHHQHDDEKRSSSSFFS
ncbi:PREDICTED: uncharacterized protein LOC104599925 [Nelumbo nucifera]|uniref:FAS1 domain-containing protein n=2 Tax=Nelumbo nucifera TaxID=4432 RepID=A0A822Z9M4_NELNU|nr:PREDICTED: uncharacterized protein LOC104599925 [Nelumbo nucifera]DAD40079.1 TPA_asm: hypothetical protein HUJ06_014402 [Nelumbo nucifera]